MSSVKRALIAALVVAGAAIVGAPGPVPPYGSVPSGDAGGPPPVGVTQSCEGGVPYPNYTVVCAKFQNGQAFVTWPDSSAPGVIVTGAAGANRRYRMYRSTSPIDAGNYASATLIASYILNNSGQSVGGNYLSSSDIDNPFQQPYRQNPAKPMSRLSDLGTPIPVWTGLQVYTAVTSGDAYYAIVSTTTVDASPVFIGSVGPVSEVVATPRAIKMADSNSRGQTYGKITLPTAGLPVVFKGHQSGAGSTCIATQCQYGDWWQMNLTPSEGWQDGRQVTFDVLQDNAQHNPSFLHNLEFLHRDTIWASDGLIGMEQYHIGLGLTPNPLSGVANRYYLTGCRQIAKELDFIFSHYGADRNNLHWKGVSMGAWGGASCGIRGLALVGGQRPAALWIAFPVWRHDLRDNGNWAGKTWSTNQPFRATLDLPPNTLGAVASNVLMYDGSVWGGTNGYADIPSFIQSDPGNDLPFTAWAIGKYDLYPYGFGDSISAVQAFQAARRGHAFSWASLNHEGNNMYEVVDCDGAVSGVGDPNSCYKRNLFALNVPYIAFSNSSIDDDPGTDTPTANGLLNGEYAGCINCGFKWIISSDTAATLNFSVDNTWMDQPATPYPATTLTGSMLASGAGTVNVASTAAWRPISSDYYALVGNDASPATQELVKLTSMTATSVTWGSAGRGFFGTTAQAHASGVTIRQITMAASGPSGGPYTNMTVDVTPRRLQGFTKAVGATVNCIVQEVGGSPFDMSATMENGNIFTLVGVPINVLGATTLACS